MVEEPSGHPSHIVPGNLPVGWHGCKALRVEAAECAPRLADRDHGAGGLWRQGAPALQATAAADFGQVLSGLAHESIISRL